MTISQKDIKLLWGRSANRCAICKIELSQDAKHSSVSYPLGEQTHIIGEKSDAARGASILSEEERNSYHNLILLCPNHHTEIDKNISDWPVEKLHMIKAQHELWVQQTLSKKDYLRKVAEQTIIISIIEDAVEICRLRQWKYWTSWALSSDPRWPSELPIQILEFREKVIATIWPKGFEELQRAIITFSIYIYNAALIFLENSEERGDNRYAYKFYKNVGRWNDNYDDDLDRYKKWVEQCNELLIEATKAANWFADVVRRDVDPMFFAKEGKFLISEYPYLLEYTEEEKAQLPSSIIQPFNNTLQSATKNDN